MPLPSGRHGTPLISHLLAVVVVGSVLLALVVTQAASDFAESRRVAAYHTAQLDLGTSLASRAAPLLERFDAVRLAVLVSATAHLGSSRVLVLDSDGIVRIDTSRELDGQSLDIITRDGTRCDYRDVYGLWEVSAPALGNSGFVGEVRLRYRSPAPAIGAFSWKLFGVVLLSCLSLIALAVWSAHGWVLRVRELARATRALANEEIGAQGFETRHGPAAGAVGDLQDAVAEVARMVDSRSREARACAIRVARQVVHGLELRGHVPFGHAERTRRYADLIASELELDAQERAAIADAALLHDLGKACVRPSALEKASGLGDEERASLRQHPLRAAGLLAGIGELAPVASAVRHQHEKWDGGGFPDGLRGDRIPLGSRVVAIAAAYDLLTTDNVYGPRRSWPDALDKLHEDRGEHFDPHLLDLFEALIRRDPQPRSKQDSVVIASGEVTSYKAADERDEDDLGEDVDAILAFGQTDLELMGDDGSPEVAE